MLFKLSLNKLLLIIYYYTPNINLSAVSQLELKPGIWWDSRFSCYSMCLSLIYTTVLNVLHKYMALFRTHECSNYKWWLWPPVSNPEYQAFWIFYAHLDQWPAVVQPYFWWLLFVKIVGCWPFFCVKVDTVIAAAEAVKLLATESLDKFS